MRPSGKIKPKRSTLPSSPANPKPLMRSSVI
jgi:hypothetical protein